MRTEVFFDVETKKLFSEIEGDDPGKLGVSIVSLYSRTVDDNLNEIEGKIQSFWESEFGLMWEIFQKADRVIGYNSIGFDVPALEPYAPFPFKKLPHFDIMLAVKEKFGKRISLDAIAKVTLGKEKKETGLDAVYLWQRGDEKSLQRLREYCEDDVLITKKIYDFVVKNGYLAFKDRWNNPIKLELDFSYPKGAPEKQIGLF